MYSLSTALVCIFRYFVNVATQSRQLHLILLLIFFVRIIFLFSSYLDQCRPFLLLYFITLTCTGPSTYCILLVVDFENKLNLGWSMDQSLGYHPPVPFYTPHPSCLSMIFPTPHMFWMMCNKNHRRVVWTDPKSTLNMTFRPQECVLRI